MLKMSNEYLMSKIEINFHIIASLENKVGKMDKQNISNEKEIKTHLSDIKFYKKQLKKLLSQLTD